MKIIVSLLFILLVSTGAEAKMGGKNVIHIHGFQPEALNPLLSDASRRSKAREQGGPALRARVDGYIYYDSAKRLSQNSNSLYQQVKQLENAGTCRKGCYFATISTGDLVARYILSRLGQWRVDNSKFKVLLSLDIVGAGGGTEGADIIVGIINGNPISAAVRLFAKSFLGVTVRPGSVVGIMNDLRPSIARSTATQANNVPRIRIVGGKTTPVVSAFIKGGDDGIIPNHSECGSARQESIYSCSRSIGIDGKLGSASGPRSLRYNHFPILMGKDLNHFSSGQYKGLLVAVNDGKNFGEFKFDVREKTRTTGWWIFKKKYRTVDKPSNMLMMDLLINEVDS